MRYHFGINVPAVSGFEFKALDIVKVIVTPPVMSVMVADAQVVEAPGMRVPLRTVLRS